MKATKHWIIFSLLAVMCFGCDIWDGIFGDNQPTEITSAFEITEIQAEGSPFVLTKNGYDPLGRYGVVPQIIIFGNANNSFDIAWLDMASKNINVSTFDAGGNPKKNIKPVFIGSTNKLLGFSKVSSDNSYVVGYSKDNTSGDKDYELWIARFDISGKMIFNTRIFGDRPNTELWSKGEPGRASSARIVYNKQTQRIGFYTGHTMCWQDNVRHQGGYIGFLDLTGKQIMKDPNSPMGNTWFFSHNFDQRLMVIEGTYYALAHGDAYPRALGFSAWTDDPTVSKNPLVNTQYFTIPGTTGENTTNTQTGGFVCLPDGNFGVIFSSSIGRTKRDACFMKLDKSGNILVTKWLTQNSTSNAVNPKIAMRGEKILVAWEDFTVTGLKANFMELDLTGEPIGGITNPENVILQPLSDWVSLPNGGIIWAVGTSEKKFLIFRIKK